MGGIYALFDNMKLNKTIMSAKRKRYRTQRLQNIYCSKKTADKKQLEQEFENSRSYITARVTKYPKIQHYK